MLRAGHQSKIFRGALSKPRAVSRPVLTRSLFSRVPDAYDGTMSAAMKEHADRSDPRFTPTPFPTQWQPGKIALQRMVENKHYQHAIDYFETMPDPNNECYNLLFEAYEKIGTPYDVIIHFLEMKKRNIRVTMTSYAWVIKAHGALGNFDKALFYFEEAKLLGPLHSKIYALVINLALDNGKIELARDMIEEVKGRGLEVDVEFYNAQIKYYHLTNNNDQILELFKLVLSSVVPANEATFLRLLHHFVEHKDIEKSFAMVQQMVDYDLELSPTKVKYPLLRLYTLTGDPQVLEGIEEFFPAERHIRDGNLKLYMSFLQLRASQNGDDEELTQAIENGDTNRIEELFFEALGEEMDGIAYKPVFDTYGDVEGPLSQTQYISGEGELPNGYSHVNEPTELEDEDDDAPKNEDEVEDDDEADPRLDEEKMKAYKKELIRRHGDPVQPKVKPAWLSDWEPWTPEKTNSATTEDSAFNDLIMRYKHAMDDDEDEATIENSNLPEDAKNTALRDLKQQKINRTLQKLKAEQPDAYRKLYNLYRAEIHGDQVVDDELIEQAKKNPFELLRAVVDTADETRQNQFHIQRNDVVGNSYRSLDYSRGPDQETKKLLSQWVKVKRIEKLRKVKNARRAW